MFTPQLPNLPADVLAMLAPAMDLIRQEVRRGANLVVGPRVNRAGEVVSRANGDGGYRDGFNRISLEVFGPALLAEIRGIPVSEVPRIAPEPSCDDCGADIDEESGNCVNWCTDCESCSCDCDDDD